MRISVRTLMLASAMAITLSACEKTAEKPAEAPATTTDAEPITSATKPAAKAIPAKNDALTFTLAGAGPFVLGASLADVSAKFPLLLDYSSEVEFGQKDAKAVGKGCEQLSAKAYPGISLMFEDGRLTRIDAVGEVAEGLANPVATALTLDDQTISPFAETKTSLRAKTGDTLTVTPHKYSETGNYLEYLPEDGTTGAVIETEGDAVIQFRVGEVPAVQYVEGCL